MFKGNKMPKGYDDLYKAFAKHYISTKNPKRSEI